MQENAFENVGGEMAAKWPQLVTKFWVNIGSSNGLLPEGTKYN